MADGEWPELPPCCADITETEDIYGGDVFFTDEEYERYSINVRASLDLHLDRVTLVFI